MVKNTKVKNSLKVSEVMVNNLDNMIMASIGLIINDMRVVAN